MTKKRSILLTVIILIAGFWSAGVTGTMNAALPYLPSRLARLMPFVVSPPLLDAQAMTDPPGHMQKL